MSTVIKKTADSYGKYRVIREVNLSHYPSADWEHNPDTSGVTNVPEMYWKHDGTSVVVEMSQGEKDTLNAALREGAAVTNETGEFIFSQWGRARNRWLRTNNFFPSNRMPWAFMNNAVISGLKFQNNNNGSDTDLEIYKNGSLYYTWEIRDKRWAWKTNGLSALTYDEGDTIGVRAKTVGGQDPMFALVIVQYRYMLQTTGEGGAATL